MWKFTKNNSFLPDPLQKVTGKDVTIIWKEEQREKFEDLKEKVCNALVLAQADLSQPFRIVTDASGHTMGIVILQHRSVPVI